MTTNTSKTRHLNEVRRNRTRRTAPRLIAFFGPVIAVIAILAFGQVGAGAQVANDDGVLFGSWAQTRGGETQIQAFQSLESQLGTQLPLLREFARWDDNLNNSTNNWAVDGGRTLMVSINPTRSDGSEVPWRTIANAQPGSREYTEMVALAEGVRQLDGEVWVAFHHEPEAGDRQSFGNSDDFIAAWRNFHNVFQQQGADVEWVWTMTSWSFEVDSADRRSAPKWYPGDDVVDFLGADPYNWNLCRNSAEEYQELERIVAPFLSFADQHPGKQLVLPEFAAAEGGKAQWLRNARDFLKRPDIASRFAAVIYFHDTQPETPNCRWWLDSDPETLSVAQSIANDPFFQRNAGIVAQEPSPNPATAPEQPAAPIVEPNPGNVCTVRSTASGDVIEWTDFGPGHGYNIRRNDVWVGETSSIGYTNANVFDGQYIVIARGSGIRTDMTCSRR